MCSFIQAKNLHYRMHAVPSFWQWLTSIDPHHRVESIDPTYKELTLQKPLPLSMWIYLMCWSCQSASW
ncbi:DUF4411 family protein [Denitrificimonas caeni]|uniref:DUF4411 family protein n=1 Tax=Denitrificimonas caeni TaxID=521720 RepID=UPI003B3A33F5